MSLFHADEPNKGTNYGDRMQRILGVCHRCKLWHEERFSDGSKKIVHDVEPYIPHKGPNAGKQIVVITPRYEKYGLSVNPKVLLDLMNMSNQIASGLNVNSVAIERDGDCVYVRVPTSDEKPVKFNDLWKPSEPGVVLLGVNEDGEAFYVDFRSPRLSHAAVIGMTGSGKSTLAKTMIRSALESGVIVALFDPSEGFTELSGHPLVWKGGCFTTPKECAAGLSLLAGIATDHKKHRTSLIFVDEIPELVRKCPEIKEYISTISEVGRHANMHLVACSQHGLTKFLGEAVKNFPLRIVGRVSNPNDAFNATGIPETGAERLIGSGDFIAWDGRDKTHFQAADPDLSDWPYPPKSPRPLPVIEHKASVGRPYDDIPKGILEWIRQEHRAWIQENERRSLSGQRLLTLFNPSLLDIEKYALEHYGAGWHRHKQHLARYLALGESCTDPLDRQAYEDREGA